MRKTKDFMDAVVSKIELVLEKAIESKKIEDLPSAYVLRARETLVITAFSELKFQTENWRIWLSRVEPLVRQKYGTNHVIIEKLIDCTWRTVFEYDGGRREN